MKKLLIIAIAVLTINQTFSQTAEQEKSDFYVNVFINQDKDIRVESELVTLDNVSDKVKNIIYNHPMKLDQGVTYRIFADESLNLGYIMDVEQQMFQAYDNNTRRSRHLLKAVKMKIDGPNWLKKLDNVKFERRKG